MRLLQDYDEVSLVWLFWRRKWLFLATFALCLCAGSYLVGVYQRGYVANTEPIVHTNETKRAFLRVRKVENLRGIGEVVRDILEDARASDLITQFRVYVDTPRASVFVIYFSGGNPMPLILERLENDAFMAELAAEAGESFALFGEVSPYFDIAWEKRQNYPQNKHYIYLDKPRPTFSKHYNPKRTEVINKNRHLRSSRIWAFMVLSSLLIAIFAVLSAESAKNLMAKMRIRGVDSAARQI